MTALAADYELEIEQGATFERRVAWYDAGGSAVDLDGATAAWGIWASRAAAGNGSPALVTGSAAVDGGEIVLGLTAAQTAGLAFLRAYYQLNVTRGLVVTRLMAGAVILSRGV